jgi:hypothetical protein
VETALGEKMVVISENLGVSEEDHS